MLFASIASNRPLTYRPLNKQRLPKDASKNPPKDARLTRFIAADLDCLARKEGFHIFVNKDVTITMATNEKRFWEKLYYIVGIVSGIATIVCLVCQNRILFIVFLLIFVFFLRSTWQWFKNNIVQWIQNIVQDYLCKQPQLVDPRDNQDGPCENSIHENDKALRKLLDNDLPLPKSCDPKQLADSADPIPTNVPIPLMRISLKGYMQAFNETDQDLKFQDPFILEVNKSHPIPTYKIEDKPVDVKFVDYLDSPTLWFDVIPHQKMIFGSGAPFLMEQPDLRDPNIAPTTKYLYRIIIPARIDWEHLLYASKQQFETLFTKGATIQAALLCIRLSYNDLLCSHEDLKSTIPPNETLPCDCDPTHTIPTNALKTINGIHRGHIDAIYERFTNDFQCELSEKAPAIVLGVDGMMDANPYMNLKNDFIIESDNHLMIYKSKKYPIWFVNLCDDRTSIIGSIIKSLQSDNIDGQGNPGYYGLAFASAYFWVSECTEDVYKGCKAIDKEKRFWFASEHNPVRGTLEMSVRFAIGFGMGRIPIEDNNGKIEYKTPLFKVAIRTKMQKAEATAK